MREQLSRRRFFLQSATSAAAVISSREAFAQARAPAPEALTRRLVEDGKREGRISWYTSVDLPIAEKVARAFESSYPGIGVRVERTGSERLFQRLNQELSSRIYAADVLNTSDAAHFAILEKSNLLAPYIPLEAAEYLAKGQISADGTFLGWRFSLSVMAYDTRVLPAELAPQGFLDLLDPKWLGKIVKGHPSYSGAILTATFQMVKALGWSYFERLAKQRVLQVQSSTDPPKKIMLGERAIMADGNEYNVFQYKEEGRPIEVVYPSEGAPLIVGPSSVLRSAPNPNAARLFQHFLFSREVQQLVTDLGGLRSFDTRVKAPSGRMPIAKIKLLNDDPAAVASQGEEIKQRYTKIFGI